MNEMVQYKGSLKYIPGYGMTLGEQCRNILKANGYESLEENTFTEYDWIDEFVNTFDDEFVISNDKIYQVLSKIEIEEDDGLFYVKSDPIGSYAGTKDYDYVVRYYNGGCSFAEAIDLALNNEE